MKLSSADMYAEQVDHSLIAGESGTAALGKNKSVSFSKS